LGKSDVLAAGFRSAKEKFTGMMKFIPASNIAIAALISSLRRSSVKITLLY
jgi:hypothetical protein